MKVVKVPIVQIHIGPRLRAERSDVVEEIAESIATQGLLQPIVVAQACP